MIFSTIEFFVLLAVILVGLSLLKPEGGKRNLLLLASYVFYGWWDWRFCFLILGSTILDYFVGIRLEKETDERKRKTLLVVSLIANLGMLGIFKYANFFIDSFAPLLQSAGLQTGTLNIILPVGISFFTFQTMSYSIDVYRRQLPATHNFRDFALFVSFFPQLVAGPIVRGSEFLPQLRDKEHPLRWDNLRVGTEIFLRGFIKKVLFADTLAVYVDPIFADPGSYSSLTCWLGVIAYSGQIYYDFSGYSEMAIGVGRMFGFHLPENFRNPYISQNITEFWRRWHMTLSRWLRDYLYIPLGGNRKGEGRTYVNLMLTMLLGGLWHGANWTFVVWGGLHGTALAVHKLSMQFGPGKALGSSLPVKLWNWALTYVFVLVTWVFFRAQDFPTAWTYLGQMWSFTEVGVHWTYVQAMVVIGFGTLFHLWIVVSNEKKIRLDLRSPVAWPLAAAALLLVLFFAPFGSNPFIYFQF